ncbi:hypothetical protein MKW98_024245 [Papaver atlanticum]|uniref:Uncharacterized protein n=1 Tax=Papaver atlanticum TaxID=357466 RepID=A0AAD4T0A9_9MAGN|nr:hypothetical protein MKW98_024245 [Papaver atlanticum]
MAISVFLKAFARRAQLPSSLSSYESVFRNVNNHWVSSPLSKPFTSSRAYCSKPDHNDPVVQYVTETRKLPESNLTKVVFKYVRANDEYQEESTPLKPVTKVLEIPRGYTYFEFRRGDDVSYCNLGDFCYSLIMRYKEVTESTTGKRVSEICLVEASFFKERIRSIMDRAAAALNVHRMINYIEKSEDFFPSDINSGAGSQLLIDLNEIFEIRIWEKITSGDKHVLEIIVSELQSNGFDFTKDPVALQKIEEAVERAMTRMTNAIKLNLPVSAGEPDMSTTISWGKCDGLPVLRSVMFPPNLLKVRRRQ